VRHSHSVTYMSGYANVAVSEQVLAKLLTEGSHCAPDCCVSKQLQTEARAAGRNSHVPWHTIWMLGNKTGPLGQVRGR
jgi:hypothetical protein